MITLIEAFHLCKIRDDEIVHLRRRGESRIWSAAYTGKEIRNKRDMKATKVLSITPHFCFGEFEGMEFEIK